MKTRMGFPAWALAAACGLGVVAGTVINSRHPQVALANAAATPAPAPAQPANDGKLRIIVFSARIRMMRNIAVRPGRLAAGRARRAEHRRAGAGGCGRGVDLPARSLRRPRTTVAFAAAIAGFLAFTRFFSPQYLVWLIPFVFILEPAAWVLAALALVLAQIWFFHYADVFALGGYVWLVLIRDLLVLALFGFALRALYRQAAEDENAVLLEHETPLGVSP